MPDHLAGHEQVSVSPNNPCPFLRALVANGYVDGHIVPLSRLSETIGMASGKTGRQEKIAEMKTWLVAVLANGHPVTSARSGAVLDELRNGPLDKHGAGSRILGVDAHVHEDQIDRLASFGQDYPNSDGGTERGLNAKQIKTYMADNLKRAGKEGSLSYRLMMAGEWPILLEMLGKGEGDARYLSIADVRTLFVDRKLPKRITDRLPPPSV